MALMRARDIRDRLRGKVDPELLHTLEVLAEQVQEQKQALKMCAQLLSRFQDTLINFGTALAAIGGRVMETEKQDIERTLTPEPPEDGETH
jgi:hypothetical protein